MFHFIPCSVELRVGERTGSGVWNDRLGVTPPVMTNSTSAGCRKINGTTLFFVKAITTSGDLNNDVQIREVVFYLTLAVKRRVRSGVGRFYRPRQAEYFVGDQD